MHAKRVTEGRAPIAGRPQVRILLERPDSDSLQRAESMCLDKSFDWSIEW